MPNMKKGVVAIVDYGLGNLFSIKHACAKVGLKGEITSSKKLLLNADAVILPGVGAFGDAIGALRRLDLIDLIKDISESDKPLIGICLGLQLFFSESYEFGSHKGLDIIKGEVVRFGNPRDQYGYLKVPQVCWNRIYPPNGEVFGKENGDLTPDWNITLLEGIEVGSFMYFVHSYYAIPKNSSVVISKTKYGHIQFCSGLKKGNIYGFQFHPERSGDNGLRIYHNLNRLIGEKR